MADIFKQRNAEPSAIYRCRLLFLVLTSLMIVGYLAIQIENIIDEIPSIRVRYDESVYLPMPAILLSAFIDKQFDLHCIFMDKNETLLIDNNKTTNEYGFAANYCSNFKHEIRTNDTNAVLILPDETLSGVRIVFNIHSNESRLRDVFYISIYDQTLAPSKEDLKFSENFDDKFVNSLYSLNKYTLIKNHNLYFKVSRRTRRAIKPSIFNYLGIPPQLKDEHYLTSILQSEYAPTTESSLYGNFGVSYQNHLTVIEEEFRVKTILNLLGLLGGGISLMLAVHALLFGSSPISPWGIIYLLPCIYKSTYDKLRVEFNENALPEILSEKSQEQVIELRKMINHLNRLDIYLKNYIDIETLKKLEDSN